MPLDQESRTVLEPLMKAYADQPVSTQTVEQGRSRMSNSLGGPAEKVHSVENRTTPGPLGPIPIRVYKPEPKPGQPLSALVFYHGGGFVMGNLDSHDPLCRAIANAVPCIVISVDYRLAPEHPFPEPVDDCYAAVQWVAAHTAELGADSGLVAVGGDSAGGNLSAVVSVLARDRQGPQLAFQLLIYPCVDITDPDGGFPSQTQFGPGSEGLLSTDGMEWMIKHYIPDVQQRTDPRFAVLRADLRGLPPALVLTAEVDPLRDEGRAYAEKLKACGVKVEFKEFSGTFHGFMSFPVSHAKEGLAMCAHALREAFGVREE